MPKYNKGLLVKTEKPISWSKIKSHFENHISSKGGPIAEGLNMVDGLLLLFKTESTVDDVWRFRPHRVGHIRVIVHIKYVPSLDVRRMIIEAKDDYSAENAKHDLESLHPINSAVTLDVVKKLQPAKLLVQYSKESEEESLQKVMNKYQKMTGKYIKPLPKTDCIKVENLPSDVLDVEISSLFENVTRTGGGTVTFVDKLNESSAVVYFASSSDAQNVCDKFRNDGMDLFGHPLEIFPYFHVFHDQLRAMSDEKQHVEETEPVTVEINQQENRVAKQQTEETTLVNVSVPLHDKQDAIHQWAFMYSDINVDLMTFLADKTEHFKKLQKILYPASVQIQIKTGLSVEGGKGMSITADLCKTKIDDFLKNYVCDKFDQFDAKKIKKVRSRFLDYRFETTYAGHRDVTVRWSGDYGCELVCVGLKTDVEALINDMKATIDSPGLRMVLEEGKFRWVMRFDTLKSFRERKVVKIATDNTKQAVVFSGHPSECAKARDAFSDSIKEIACKEYQPKTKCVKTFLMKASTKEAVSNRICNLINENGEQVLLIVKENELFLYGSTNDIGTARSKLDGSFMEDDFSLSYLNQSSSLKKSIRGLEAEGKIEIIPQVNGAKIIGFNKAVEYVKELLQQGQRKVTEKEFKISAIKAKFFLTKHDELQDMLKNRSVTAEMSNHGIILKGESPNVLQVMTKLELWKTTLIETQKWLVEPGAMQYLKSATGRDMLDLIGTKHNTAIRVRTEQGTIQSFDTNVVSDARIGSIDVRIKHGDITEESSDAVVCTSLNYDLTLSTLASTILKKGGNVIETELRSSNDKFVRVTSGGNLHCKHIIHVPAPLTIYDIAKCISNVMEEADKLKCNTLALPVILPPYTETMRNAEIAEAMLKSINIHANKKLYVKQISLIISERFRLDGFHSTLSKYQGQKLNSKTSGVITSQPNGRENGRFVSRDFGNIKVTVRQGDITKETNDAIVNSTGSSFDLGLGMVSKAIIKHGGTQIQTEVNRAVGNQIRVTNAGNLSCKSIIHVVTPTRQKELHSCLHDILARAENIRLQSISIPALGTGNIRMDSAEVGKIFSQSFADYQSINPTHRHLKIVDVVIFETGQLKKFCAGFSSPGSSALGKVWSNVSSLFKSEERSVHNTQNTTYPGHDGRKGTEARGSKVDVESVVFEFCSKSRYGIDQAWSTVMRRVTSILKTERLTDSRIKLLKPEDQIKILNIGEALRVSVTLRHENTLVVSGLGQGVDDAIATLKNILQSLELDQMPTGGHYPH